MIYRLCRELEQAKLLIRIWTAPAFLPRSQHRLVFRRCGPRILVFSLALLPVGLAVPNHLVPSINTSEKNQLITIKLKSRNASASLSVPVKLKQSDLPEYSHSSTLQDPRRHLLMKPDRD